MLYSNKVLLRKPKRCTHIGGRVFRDGLPGGKSLEIVGRERLDKLVKLPELVLGGVGVVMADDGAGAVHDVVLNIDGRVGADGEGDGVARARVDRDLAGSAVVGGRGEHEPCVEDGRIDSVDFGALELDAELLERVDKEVVRDGAVLLRAVEPTADGGRLVRAGLDGERASRCAVCLGILAFPEHDERWNGPGGHYDGLDINANHDGTSRTRWFIALTARRRCPRPRGDNALAGPPGPGTAQIDTL